MRGRLVLVSAAVTAMVAIAFLAPLFILVEDLVHDRAVSRAERDVEEVARVLALLWPERNLEEACDGRQEASARPPCIGGIDVRARTAGLRSSPARLRPS